MSERKRLLNDLRVVDLRAELEKRNLDKSGVRGVLLNRLSKHLEEEGHDPATYEFELAVETKTPVKRVRRSESAVEAESEETPTMEDMIVQDDAGEDDDVDENNQKESQDGENMDEETLKASRKRELKEDNDSPSAKKACIEKNEKEDDLKAENNTDAEDSINLELGEDELLNEETDHTAKSNKKDEAEAAAADEQQGDDEQGGDTADQQVTDEAPPSSETGEGTDKDKKDEKERDDDKKERKDEGKEGGARNLWVSGLSGDTRAKDLKQLCSKHGKVIGAKVVTNARTPGSRCYGYVTMASAQDAESCIKNLHRTELHGRIISVEKAKSESESASRRQTTRDRRSSTDIKDDNKEEGKEGGDEVKKEGEGEGRSTSRTRERSHRSEKDRGRRSTRSKEIRRSPREVLSFSKIWKERDIARARERSRLIREEERRRRAADDALRERERRQRQEKHRLVLEREKLRQEREKIEREKNELLRLERERHRLEREKLELERLELKRAQLRLEDERRKRGFDPPTYRKSPHSPLTHPVYDPRHKRPQPTSSSRQFEAPPPPRFDTGTSYDRDKRDREREYKRDYPRHVSASSVKYPTNGTSNEETRQAAPPGTRPKEPSRSTYEARSGYRSPPKDVRSWPAARPNYPDPAKRGGGSGASSGEQWSERSAGGTGAAGGGAGAGSGGYRGESGPSSYFQPLPPGAYGDRADRTTAHYAPHTRDYRKY